MSITNFNPKFVVPFNPDSENIPGLSGNGGDVVKQTSDAASADILQKFLAVNGLGGGQAGVTSGSNVSIPGVSRQEPRPTNQKTAFTGSTSEAGGAVTGLLGAISNAVNRHKNQKDEKEAKAVETDLDIIRQASQKTGNPDIDNHNAQVLQQMYEDPKRMKRIEKAIGYNPFSGAENAHEKGFLSFLTKIKKGGQDQTQAPNAGGQQQSAAGMIQGRSPQSMQPNAQMQMTAFLIKEGLIPDANHVTSFFEKALTNQKDYDIALAKLQQNGSIEAIKLAHQLEVAKISYDKAVKTHKIDAASREAVAQTNKEARVKSAELRTSATSTTKELLKYKQAEINSLDKTIQERQRDKSHYTNNKDSASASKQEAEIAKLQAQKDKVLKEIDALGKNISDYNQPDDAGDSNGSGNNYNTDDILE